MQRRRLGASGPEVSAIGYGAMSLSGTYGASDDAESLDALHAVVDSGIDLIDTAEAYGGGHNERLVGRFLAETSARVFVSTKFGIYFDGGAPRVDCSPTNARRAVEGSLERLGVECIDLYYAHRVDANVPIEETVGALAELVHAGKIAHVGLSACKPDTLRRAAAVHPITAVQSEYSLWTRDPERGVLAACDEVGAGFVPYSPLGRGFLADQTPDADALDGFRRHVPRLAGANLDHNMAIAREIQKIATELGLTTSQLALAWCTARGEHVVPIFGTRRRARVIENALAGDVVLDAATLERLDAVSPPGATRGSALPEFMASLAER
ncbi:MAG: aldo/keto reductase [Myxococcota bacterium]